MAVVFDPHKDQSNLRKHGISLQRAEDFDFASAFYDVDDSQDYGEVRYNAIGWIAATLYTLSFTQQDSTTRPISLRKATRHERELYAEEF